MSIGVSIFLIALGAIIAFALKLESRWLDLQAVGWILMVAGVIGLVITTTMWRRRRTLRVVGDGDGHQHTIDEADRPSSEPSL